MADGSWEFSIAKGVVTVRSDSIGIRMTPQAFLRGQYVQLRNGSIGQQVQALLNLCAFAFTPIALALHLDQLLGPGQQWAFVPFAVFGLVTLMWGFWITHLRESSIPLSAVEFVSIDESAQTIRIAHERPNGLLSRLTTCATQEQYALRGAEDARRAKEAFQLRGIEPKSPSDLSTTTEYRFTSRQGVCFCDQCHSQVSPSDRVCPSCEYLLRVESPLVE
ncbi:hypothetical protein N0B31_11400 [Salinirubellus salinus]|uniref:Uncharacterized protein n=1 Tax=Salinirubellus salinus TaxID=1364945 RepID=A0A9E7U970_9EURY|nr:hypothetical protein [Salinirubellus salinus]UWM52757.1 hypothetical protein N0B31_11400 [Salinirubellus salinus]